MNNSSRIPLNRIWVANTCDEFSFALTVFENLCYWAELADIREATKRKLKAHNLF